MATVLFSTITRHFSLYANLLSLLYIGYIGVGVLCFETPSIFGAEGGSALSLMLYLLMSLPAYYIGVLLGWFKLRNTVS